MYIEKWPNGNKKIEARYEGGNLNGDYFEYWKNGTFRIRAGYKESRLTGPYVEYYENGENNESYEWNNHGWCFLFIFWSNDDGL